MARAPAPMPPRPSPWRALLPLMLGVLLLHAWLIDVLGPVGARASLRRAVMPASAAQTVSPSPGSAEVRLVALAPPAPPLTPVTPATPATPAAGVTPASTGGAVGVGTVRSAEMRPQPTAARPVSPVPRAPATTQRSRDPAAGGAVTTDHAPVTPEVQRLPRSVSPAQRAEPAPAEPAMAVPGAELSPPGETLLALAPPAPGARPAGVTAAGRPAAPNTPLPTTVPAPAELIYTVRRGALSGEGRLMWRPVAGAYSLTLEARLPLIGVIFSETSTGSFDAWGLAPQRYVERRIKRSERALTMTRDAAGGGSTLSFSASTIRLPLPPGAQDRLSWLVQLASLYRAAVPGSAPLFTSGADLPVASVTGDLSQWQFRATPAQAGLLHLERRPPGPYDTLAEVWLDPARQHWPVRVRLTESGGEPLELQLKQMRE